MIALPALPALPILLFTAVCIGVWVLVRFLRPNSSRHNVWCGILRRYPHGFDFFGLGLVAQAWRDFHNGQHSEGIRSRHVLYGSTFSAKSLGNNYIYTIEPQNIDAITDDESHNFKKSEWASEAAKHIGNGILLNEGEAWKLSRTTLRPMFSSNSIDEPTLMEPHVSRLIAKMVVLSENEGNFEFHCLADMFMLDVVTEFLFGKSQNCLESPRSPAGDDGVEFLAHVRNFDGPSASFIALGAPAKIKLLLSNKKLNKTVVGMKAFFERKLADIMASTEDSPARTAPWSVFKMMKSRNIPDEQIQGELQNIFFASWDTTSALLANTVYVLLRHQHVQDRLREEIRPLQGIPPTRQDLNNMEYLRLVVKEALRLYSPVTLHSRRAKADTILPRGGGQDSQSPILVREGTTVVWSTYSMNRDPRWYGQDWAEYRPERWTSLIRPRATLSIASTAGQGGTDTDIGADESQIGGRESRTDFFMPFGSGPRACLGQQMAQNEVSYVIVRLLQEFPSLMGTREEEAEQTPFREAKAVSFRKADGVWVSVNRDRHRELGQGN